MDCSDQEGCHRPSCFVQQPTGLMCWGQRGHHRLESQAHTPTYTPRVLLTVQGQPPKNFSSHVQFQELRATVGMPAGDWSGAPGWGLCRCRSLKISIPQGFSWDPRGRVWPVALLPTEESNYGPLQCMVLKSFLVLARLGSKVDQKAWVLFSKLTFTTVQ